MTEPARSLFGLSVHSELPLPDLPITKGERAQVRVSFGKVPQHDERVSASGEGDLVLRIDKVGRFLISGGTSIVIDPAEGAQERELRLFLLGSAFGALLHQRGLLPLHANSIEIGGKAVAFLGRSGAGKSTLAHWFQRQGFAVLADDVSAIAVDGAPLAMPGVPRLRLWQDAIEASGLRADDYPRSFEGHDKFDVAAAAHSSGPRPLAACYLLAEGAECSVEQLTGVDASEALIANTYRGSFVPLLGIGERHLIACIQLARQVPVFRATRRWNMEHFETDAARLREHSEATAAARPAQAA